MKKILNFLLEVNKLKEIPRTGWVWLEAKRPETIAEHIFRVAVVSWVLAKERKLNVKRAIKIALFHDLCEVYAGDMTPYFELLPEDKEKRKKFLTRWVRLSKKEKEKRAQKKFEIEKKSLLKLIKNLKPKTRDEILTAWLDYEKGFSKEGRFVKQIDKIETMLQAIEYFGVGENSPVIGWWEEIEELADDPLIFDFLELIQKKFYRKKTKKKFTKLQPIFNFILEINKLKTKERRGWILRKVKNPETIASHTYFLTVASFILFKELDLKFDEEKLLKMALVHELSKVYVLDRTPYESIFNGEDSVFKKWIRFSKKEKMKNFLKEYREEKRGLEKLTKKLPSGLKKEIFNLWDEFRQRKTRKAHFLNQVYTFVTLLQAHLYWQRNKENFSIEPWWEWAFESIDHPLILEMLDELKLKFIL